MVVYAQTVIRAVTLEVIRPLFISVLQNKTESPFNKKYLDDFVHPKWEGMIVDMSRAAGWTKANHDGKPDEVIEAGNGNGGWLVPEASGPTVADLLMFSECIQMEHLGLADAVYERRPAYKKWIEKCKALPGQEAIIAKIVESPVFGKFLALLPKE